MKTKKGLLAMLLVLVLVACLVPMGALAAPAESTPTPAPTTEAASPEPEEAAEAEVAEAPVTAELEPVFVEADEELYAEANHAVYNNGGLVYNNGGTVYNNGGTVYNNGGIVYNNNGTVYSNGGTVYNNTGSVFNNGAEVFTHGGSVKDSHIYGYFSFSLAEDYSALVSIEGLDEQEDGELLISQDAVCTITANAGYTITDANVDAGIINSDDEGVYTLSEVDANVTLMLGIKVNEPELSLASGSYGKAQRLEMTAAEGAEIYFTTDGSEPQAASDKYTKAIEIDSGMEIKAVAVAAGAQMSDIASASYSIVALTAPNFDAVEAGYTAPAAQGILVENSGDVAAKIESVAIAGKDADSFKLSRTGGKTIAAGASDEKSWTIQPIAGLEKGSYSATVSFTFDSGETAEVKISFRVK